MFDFYLKNILNRTFPIFSLLVLVIGSLFLYGYKIIIFPGILTAVLYHWLIYRIKLVPPLLLVIFGCIYDVFMGGRIGITATLFIVSYYALLYLRKHVISQQFEWVWAGYALYSSTYCFLYFLLILILKNKAVIFSSAFLDSILLNIAIYPLTSWILIYLFRRRS